MCCVPDQVFAILSVHTVMHVFASSVLPRRPDCVLRERAGVEIDRP